nr:ATP-binding protein [Sphingomonas quercus]
MRAKGTADTISGRVSEALRDFQQALEIYRAAGEPRGQAMALQNIGIIYTDAGEYERVLRYYEQANEAYGGDPMLTATAHNNIGRAWRELGRLDRAEQEFKRALDLAREARAPAFEQEILENLAWTQLAAGRLADGDLAIARAMQLGTRGDGGISPFLWGVAAKSAVMHGDLPRARALIQRTMQAPGANDEPAFREFQKTAYEIYKRSGDERQALAHFEIFKRLDDRARELTTSTSAALMAARFDFANQNMRITSLKAGQIERDAKLAVSRARLRTTLITGALGIAVIVSGLSLIAFFSIRRSRNETRDANASLSTANVALEKALRAKTEFLATTSHEIRTPLNGILGMTQVILADRSVEPGLHDRIKLVHNAGETMRALVDDLLDVAKMETGNLTIESAPASLHEILRHAVQLWADHGAAKNVAVTLDLGDTPDGIVTDEARLRQVVFNLMSNAVKFTDKGSVGLCARVLPGDPEMLAITVADTGIGIPEDKFADIFESFRQVDGGTTRQFGGTGLGLTICRQIVDAMGGSVTLESVLGEGSAFTIMLPLKRAEGFAGRRDKDGEPDAILLIEANPLTRSVLSALLAKAFPRVVAVEDVREAISALDAERYAAILVDGEGLVEPGELVMTLRDLCDMSRGAPITLLHPTPGPDDPTDLKQAGATQLMVKPVSGQALLRLLAPLSTKAKAA